MGRVVEREIIWGLRKGSLFDRLAGREKGALDVFGGQVVEAGVRLGLVKADPTPW